MESLKTYEEARTYINTISKTGSILGLESIQNLMNELENVQDELKIIHIAGTNGKGSTGAFLAAILQKAGYTVGRYTSPAVFEPLEVWRINGRNISIEDYVTLLSQVKTACDNLVRKGMPHPTVFEVETALAFLYFYQKKCDFVLLETGMGGREDATNLIKHPICSVLTTISMDHMKFLGDTLGKIAGEKAGIIKDHCPVFSALQHEDAMLVIKEEARKKHAGLIVADEDALLEKKMTEESITFIDETVGQIRVPMSGGYQFKNVSLALEVTKWLLQERANAGKIIQEGLAQVKWPGRFEILQQEPLFIIDGAHNEDAALQLRETLENCFTNRRITYIIGVLADKEHEKMLKIMLPLAEQVYTVTPHNIRALQGELLAKEAKSFHDKVSAMNSVEAAVERAVQQSEKEDVILAFGSLSYLNEVREAVGARVVE